MKISPVTRLFFAGLIFAGTLSGCDGVESISSTHDIPQDPSESVSMLVAAIARDEYLLDCGVDPGCMVGAYLNDVNADQTISQPESYFEFSQSNDQSFSFLGTDLNVNGEINKYYVISDNINNRSLILDVSNIAAISEILIDIVYGEDSSDHLSQYSLESLTLAYELQEGMDYQALCDAIAKKDYFAILQSIINNHDDFKSLFELASYLNLNATICEDNNIQNLAGVAGVALRACRETTKQNIEMRKKLDNEFKHFLIRMGTSYIDPENPLSDKNYSIERYVTQKILASFNQKDPTQIENISYTEYVHGDSVYLIDNFGNIYTLDVNGNPVSINENVYRAALNVLAQSEYGTTHTNDFAIESWRNSTYALSSKDITRSDLLDYLASLGPADVLNLLMLTLTEDRANNSLEDVIRELSEMGPYYYDFQSEVERLYRRLQEIQSYLPMEPEFTGDFAFIPSQFEDWEV